ncbi:MAG: hypothetical protein AAF518_21910 [Spirochaetota bacterium]
MSSVFLLLLVSLRNLDDSQHCHQSFLYFYEKLADSSSNSIKEQSIDLEIYENTRNFIQDKYFMYLGYTTLCHRRSRTQAPQTKL